MKPVRFKFWLCLFLFISVIFSSAAEVSPEVRGLWIVRHNLKNSQTIDSVFTLAHYLKLTDLFFQIRGRGDAFYNSHFEPLAEEISPEFDPLAYILQKNEQYGFRIHAWINVFYLWSKPESPRPAGHILNHKPQWLALPAFDPNFPNDFSNPYNGNSEGFFISPLLPEVQQHILNIINDILSQYAVDGIHLDYIRYPGRDFDFNPQVRNSFKNRYLFDPLDFKAEPEKFAQTYGPVGYELYYLRWARFLKDGLSQFVQKLSGVIRKNYPQCIISAAVKPDLAMAHWHFYQHWDKWLQEGWIDWALPMNYTPDSQLFLSRIRKMLQQTDPSRCIMGIALYNQTNSRALKKIEMMNSLPFKGYVLFSYDQIGKKGFGHIYNLKFNKKGEKK